MTDNLTVSQEAREAAANVMGASFRIDDWLLEWIKRGDADQGPVAQAFARFEATIRADERARVLEEALHEAETAMLWHDDSDGDLVVTAIRALKDQQPGASS